MKIYILMVLMFFAVAQSQAQCDKNKKTETEKANADKKMPEKQTKFENLPDGAKLNDEVREEITDKDGKVIENKIITVEEKLRKIGAKYQDGKLVDNDGREIRFYKPPVRGTSQGFEEDQKQAKLDAEELKELQEKYTVIILYVNPLKVM
jgi:hypothetical protein